MTNNWMRPLADLDLPSKLQGALCYAGYGYAFQFGVGGTLPKIPGVGPAFETVLLDTLRGNKTPPWKSGRTKEVVAAAREVVGKLLTARLWCERSRQEVFPIVAQSVALWVDEEPLRDLILDFVRVCLDRSRDVEARMFLQLLRAEAPAEILTRLNAGPEKDPENFDFELEDVFETIRDVGLVRKMMSRGFVTVRNLATKRVSELKAHGFSDREIGRMEQTLGKSQLTLEMVAVGVPSPPNPRDADLIDTLAGLSSACQKRLRDAGIRTVGELVREWTTLRLWHLHQFGHKFAGEVDTALRNMGYRR